MKKTPKIRHIIAYILVACMLLSVFPVAMAANQSQRIVMQEVDITADNLMDDPVEVQESDAYAADEALRVIIIFEEASLIERGFSTAALAQNSSAMICRASIETQQEVGMAAVNAALGEELEIRYNFTIGLNGVATTVRYEQIETIEALSGVKSVYIENQYMPDVEEADPDTSTAGTMIGSYSAWADGYTGAGSRIAIIDTGLDTDHPSFDESCYLYSLELSAARFGKEIADYDLLDAEEVASVLSQLHAAELYDGLTAEDLYYSAKVPFAFNYVDENLKVTHDTDTQGDHGTHVSGIAAANTYVWSKDSDGDMIAASQAQGVVGVAPDAQIITMKVFGSSGGAYDSDYMAAIEDAIVLGCDTVNLSLGSVYPGHTYSNYEEIFGGLTTSDTVVTISAGNKYSYAYFNNTGTYMMRTEDTVINTIGSPGAYPNSLAVASVNNNGLTGQIPYFNGIGISYNDTYESYKINSFSALDTSADGSGTAYEYMFLGDPVAGTNIYGAAEDFDGLDLTGKVVLISRGGGVSFYEKANRAVEAGAAATIVYNNVDGSISMNLTGYSYKNPAISIDLSYAESILASSSMNGGAWTGTVVVSQSYSVIENVNGGYEPSVFSSWGIPGNMDLKPEITAPGGNIWSTTTDGTYGLMSGTSMSAPSVAGMGAVVAQYISENGLDEQEGLTVRALSQALLMSTSTPLLEDGTIEYSPRQQGSGLGNVYAAVTSPAYLLTDAKADTDGKVKAVLGDDPDETGVYTFSFTINNMYAEDLVYTLDSSINTMSVETIGGVDYMSDTAYALDPEVVFTTEAGTAYVYDLNKDGAVDSLDAEVLLKAANGTATLSEFNAGKYDFDADGQITSADARIYLESLRGDTSSVNVFDVGYVVAAGESISCTVTITLSEADRAYFAENYVNGCYVEGFIYVTDPDGVNPQLSIPMVAYYGAWTDASMFDAYIALEHYYDPDAYPYVGTGVTNAMVVGGYVLTSNPYASGSSFLADRTALTSSTNISYVYSTLLRNAGGDLYVEVTNAETGEVYKTVDMGAQYGAYYSTSSGAWANTLISTTLGWKPTDASGNPLPEGTKINVSVYAIPEYNWDRETGKVVGTLGEGACWNTSFTVDNTAPKILDGSYTTNWITGSSKLNVTVQDNRYTAAILVMNERQTEVLARQGIDQTELGAAVDVEVDITGIEAGNIVVVAVDYAGNMTGYSVSLGSDADEGDVTEYLYMNDCLHDEWLSFKPDNYDDAKVVASGECYAAEYIDGYVFTVDASLRLCVAPLSDMENQTYIETLNLPSNALDMAYNYADGKLYVLCTNNYLYTIDPLMGTTSNVGIIPLPAGNNLQTLACSTEGTFYGVTNNQTASKLYSFTIGEEGFETYAYPNNTGMSTLYIQSMAYDHNTGKLYHANYGINASYTNYVGTLVSYDLETGVPTVLADLGTLEMCGMFIPKQASSIFGPSQDVQEISLSQSEVSMLKGSTLALEVSAKPWTVVNRECSWTSSDESVATVKDGVVTAVGAGTCTIAATSVLNPQAIATCTVTVSTVETDLDAIVWDENGAVWFSTFNTETIPAYTKLTETSCEAALMARAAGTDGTVYAASYEVSSTGSLISSLYTVGSGYSLTKVGTSTIGYTDMTVCPNVDGGTLFATYGTYVAIVSQDTGDYAGAWNFSSTTGTTLAGITYYTTSDGVDYCLVLDSNGCVWLVGFYTEDGSYLRTSAAKVADLGYDTDGYWYFSSIAADSTYLYCSIFNGTETQLVVLDLATGAIGNQGSFGTEVWPIAGLMTVSTGTETPDMIEDAINAIEQLAPSMDVLERVPAMDAETE